MIRFSTLLTIFALFLTACSSGDDADNLPTSGAADIQVTAQAAEPALPLNDEGIQLVARVNGEGITLNEFEDVFAQFRSQNDSASYDAIAANVIDVLIEQYLIRQAAANMDISISDAEINTALQEHKTLIPDENEWQQWLTTNGFADENEFRNSLYDDLITKQVIENVTANGESIQVNEVHARHILLETEAEANDVLNQLNNGADFAQLAATYSKDITTRENGGDLGWFNADGLLTPELTEAAFAAQPNEIVGPIETMLGYHILQTLEFQQRTASAEEQPELVAEQFTTWLQTLLNDAVIERYVNY